MSSRPPEIVEDFYRTCTDAGLTPPFKTGLGRAVEDWHYGFVMQDNLSAAMDLIRSGNTHLPVEDIPGAMATLAAVLTASGEQYRLQDGHITSPDAWREHEAHARAGDITLVQPASAWTTVDYGKRQVQRANTVLGLATSGAQTVLAALNYDLYFKPNTMAGHARQLAESPEIVANSEELEAMPHVSVTNWAIGQTVQHIYERMAERPRGRMHVIDMCSGTGATLAAIVNRLEHVVASGSGLDGDRLSLMGIETTPGFFRELSGDFLPSAWPKLDSLGIIDSAVISQSTKYHDKPKPGEITLVEDDVVSTIAGLDLSWLSSEDVVVATANYAFHRLPDKRKAYIMRNLTEAENSIVVIGDLRQNGSKVNRGFFNLSNNGPLNAGNIDLEACFRDHGYSTLTIAQDGYQPEFVEDILRGRLAEELQNDGFVTIAFRGTLASELIHDRW